MQEVWKTIEEFPRYEVSNYGRIRLKSTKRLRKTEIKTGKCGYKSVEITFREKDKYYRRKVSRLVAMAFIDGYFEGAQCGHRDDDSTNNIYTNLYWTTPSENNIHNGRAQKVANLKRKNGDYERHSQYMKGKYSKTVIQYSLDGEFISEYSSCREAERQTGLNNAHIGRAARGEYTQYNGYVWKYK